MNFENDGEAFTAIRDALSLAVKRSLPKSVIFNAAQACNFLEIRLNKEPQKTTLNLGVVLEHGGVIEPGADEAGLAEINAYTDHFRVGL